MIQLLSERELDRDPHVYRTVRRSISGPAERKICLLPRMQLMHDGMVIIFVLGI